MDTVRAYGYERRFALESDERVNYNNRCAVHCCLPALCSPPLGQRHACRGFFVICFLSEC